MTAVYLALKDLRLLLRDRIALFWVFGFPMIFALFIGAVVRAGLSGEAGPLKVVLVDEAESEASQRFAKHLHRVERLQVTQASTGDALEAVRRANAVAYFRLPRDFGTSTAGAERPELGFDPARELEMAYVEQLLIGALGRLQPDVVESEVSFDRKQVFAARPTAQGAADIVFPSAVMWGLIGCAACFAISLVSERTRGTYLRLRALPLPRHVVLAGKALSSLIASLVVAALLTVIGVLIQHGVTTLLSDQRFREGAVRVRREFLAYPAAQRFRAFVERAVSAAPPGSRQGCGSKHSSAA